MGRPHLNINLLKVEKYDVIFPRHSMFDVKAFFKTIKMFENEETYAISQRANTIVKFIQLCLFPFSNTVFVDFFLFFAVKKPPFRFYWSFKDTLNTFCFLSFIWPVKFVTENVWNFFAFTNLKL